MQYITGDAINTTSISWTTPRGAKAELTLVRNARLIENGWISSTSHAIQLMVNGTHENYYGALDDASLGYVLHARMGKAVLPVPVHLIAQVKTLLAEREQHNTSALQAEIDAENEYQDRHDAIERMRTNGRA